MSTDTKTRELERKAASGDLQAAARLEASKNRVSEGRVATLRKYVGREIYIQGARMNYVGTLSWVTSTADGSPGELYFEKLKYTGEWNRQGPVDQYSMDMPCEPDLPQMIPWGAVDQFGISPWEGK